MGMYNAVIPDELLFALGSTAAAADRAMAVKAALAAELGIAVSVCGARPDRSRLLLPAG